MDIRERELYAVLEEAEHRIQENPDADQVIVVKTSKANVYHFANYQVQAGNREDEIRFINLLREQDDKEILYLAAMWNNGEVDLPSHHFRSLIMELSPRNGEAVMPLRGEVGYLVRTVGATMP